MFFFLRLGDDQVNRAFQVFLNCRIHRIRAIPIPSRVWIPSNAPRVAHLAFVNKFPAVSGGLDSLCPTPGITVLTILTKSLRHQAETVGSKRGFG